MPFDPDALCKRAARHTHVLERPVSAQPILGSNFWPCSVVIKKSPFCWRQAAPVLSGTRISDTGEGRRSQFLLHTPRGAAAKQKLRNGARLGALRGAETEQNVCHSTCPGQVSTLSPRWRREFPTLRRKSCHDCHAYAHQNGSRPPCFTTMLVFECVGRVTCTPPPQFHRLPATYKHRHGCGRGPSGRWLAHRHILELLITLSASTPLPERAPHRPVQGANPQAHRTQ